MTKEFCDACKKEVKSGEPIKIIFHRPNMKLGSYYESIAFCEKCYLKVDKQMRKIIPMQAQVATELA